MAVGSTDEVGEISVTAVDGIVTVKMGIIPLPGSPVLVGTMLGLDIMVSTVGLAVVVVVFDGITRVG